MATWLVVLLFSAGAVLLFVVGLSLTLMIKGRHIDSEIAANRHMRARGITCAAADARNDASSRTNSPHCEGGVPLQSKGEAADCADSCASCGGSSARSGDSTP